MEHHSNRYSRSSYSGPRNRRLSGRERGEIPKRSGRGPGSEKGRGNLPLKLLIGGGLALCIAASAAVFSFRRGGTEQEAEAWTESQTEEETAAVTGLAAEGTFIEGIDVSGMTGEEAREAVLSAYPWKLYVSHGEESFPVANLLERNIDELLTQVWEQGEAGTYTVDRAQIRRGAADEAAVLAKQWDVSPKPAALESFDVESGSFVFTESCSGLEINQEQLIESIMQAVEDKNLNQVIEAQSADVPPGPEEDVKSKYKTLAIFTTETTDNAKRNKNVKLSADALNGTVVLPGQEFSFNAVVGERTSEKGYQEAAAYSSGAVVQEIGGGVCQMSSTLYRVAFQSGMKITYRRSHTFEPNYVTPGQDAAISWGQPDFRFVNTSSYPIGIRASYSDRKATVSIYGVPVLEEGVTWDLYSEKVEDLPLPEPTYIEDQTLAPGTEKTVKAGSRGSTWVTYKVIYKDGQEVERVKDHEKTYKGHAPEIRRNTSSVTLKPEETQAPASTEAAAPTVDGMPDGYVPSASGAPETSASADQPEEAALPGGETVPAPPQENPV